METPVWGVMVATYQMVIIFLLPVILMSSSYYREELQRRFFEDFWGGPLILDPWFWSYIQGKRQANLHGVVLISVGLAAWYWIQA